MKNKTQLVFALFSFLLNCLYVVFQLMFNPLCLKSTIIDGFHFFKCIPCQPSLVEFLYVILNFVNSRKFNMMVRCHAIFSHLWGPASRQCLPVQYIATTNVAGEASEKVGSFTLDLIKRDIGRNRIRICSLE